MFLTLPQLKTISGISDINILNGINETLSRFNINTPLRIAHFIAQILHESGGLKITKENLNYSANGLLNTFPKYFNSTTANAYARQPEKIANKVYSNRMGNGSEASGDGYKYKGRGYIQLTGKANYEALKKDTGIDFISNPQLLETAEYAALSAGWFWNKNRLNELADRDDLIGITKKINGATNGIDDRRNYLDKAKNLLG